MDIRTFHLLAIATVLISMNGSSGDPGPAKLIWSSERNEFRSSGIYSAPADPRRQRFVGKYIMSKRVISLKLPHFIGSVDSNDDKGEISIMDVGRGNLAVVDRNTRSILRYHKGLTEKAKAVSIDWTTGNVYWSDPGHKWIVVSTTDFKQTSTVVENVPSVRGLAVYPQKGLLFWTQLGDEMGEAKVMRSTLSGEKVSTVALTLGMPTALSVDYQTEKIYWIDKSDMTIYFAASRGNSPPEMLFRNTTVVLEDLHVYGEWLYVTANNVNQILMLNKSSGEVLRRIGTHLPTAVTTVGGGSQPMVSGPCDIKNGGCEHFCFPQPPGNLRKCGCSLGTKLGSDGTSCFSDLMKSDFHLVVDSDMQWIFQVSADGRRSTKLNIPGLDIPVQTQFDPDTGRVYWTDIGTSSINRANLDGSNHVIIASKNVRQPTGLALDRYSGNLYWTDEGTGAISVVRSDGKHHKTLLSDNVTLPRGLVIDPTLGYMWWSDWGAHTIEMSRMDGTDRRVIVDSDVEWVNGLAIDYSVSKIYWCDAKKDTVEVADMDGKNRKVLKKFNGNDVHLFGIDISNEYVYMTDWGRSAILRMRKDGQDNPIEEFGPHIFDKPSDVHSFIGGEVAKLENDTTPCQKANGNCTGLCISVPSNHSSTTNDLKDDERFGVFLTTRVCLCGNEPENKDCDKPSNKTDGTAPSFNGTCPGALTFVAAPCNDKALVDYKVPSAIDDSGSVLLELPAQTPPVNLAEGVYEHRYTALDPAGNHDTCAVTIIVKVVRCLAPKFDGRPIEVVNSSCSDLLGSRAMVRCVNGSSSFLVNDEQYLECDRSGEWEGDPMCFFPTTTAESTTTTATPRTYVTSTTTELTTKDARAKNGRRFNEGAGKQGKDDPRPSIPLNLVIPIAIALVVIIAAAIGYKCYRSHSIPLLEIMEKTVAYRNDDLNRDTFKLDLDQNQQEGEDPVTRSDNLPGTSGGSSSHFEFGDTRSNTSFESRSPQPSSSATVS